VRNIVKIAPADAAWYSAVAAVGATIIGTLGVWPLMRRSVAQYDASHNADGTAKDAETGAADKDGKFKDVDVDQ
jgi:hypothetical protein